MYSIMVADSLEVSESCFLYYSAATTSFLSTDNRIRDFRCVWDFFPLPFVLFRSFFFFTSLWDKNTHTYRAKKKITNFWKVFFFSLASGFITFYKLGLASCGVRSRFPFYLMSLSRVQSGCQILYQSSIHTAWTDTHGCRSSAQLDVSSHITYCSENIIWFVRPRMELAIVKKHIE